MDESKPPEGTEDKAEETEDKPELVTVAKEEYETLRRIGMKYLQMLDNSTTLTVQELEERAGTREGGPEEWGGAMPGMFLLARGCGHYKGLDAIYFRGYLGLRCRVCKRLAHRVKVAEAPIEGSPAVSEKVPDAKESAP